MPRPLRIEYENAYYHVMNRGRGRQRIFPDDEYYSLFLELLAQAHRRFGLQVLCYCLMSNHYHLLVKTPEGNLGRCMRHINGLYTQRYNKQKRTDGPLFRGRYKAICVEADSYQLQLSCYIHRNPLEARLVKNLADYPWSSYNDYANGRSSQEWLYQGDIQAQLGVPHQRYFAQRYRVYVEQGIDEEIRRFYGRGNQMPYLGSEDFRSWAYEQRETIDSAVNRSDLQQFRPTVDEWIIRVSKSLKIEREDILRPSRGGLKAKVARDLCMYLCREEGGHKLVDIAEVFGFKRYGSVSTAIRHFETQLAGDLTLQKLLKKFI